MNLAPSCFVNHFAVAIKDADLYRYAMPYAFGDNTEILELLRATVEVVYLLGRVAQVYCHVKAAHSQPAFIVSREHSGRPGPQVSRRLLELAHAKQQACR